MPRDERRVIGSTDVYGRKTLDKRHDSMHRRIDLYGEKISDLREQIATLRVTLEDYKREVRLLIASALPDFSPPKPE